MDGMLVVILMAEIAALLRIDRTPVSASSHSRSVARAGVSTNAQRTLDWDE
jgi:hypothetical protein